MTGAMIPAPELKLGKSNDIVLTRLLKLALDLDFLRPFGRVYLKILCPADPWSPSRCLRYWLMITKRLYGTLGETARSG